jgi:hypothetical protein
LVWNHDNATAGVDNWTRLCFGDTGSADCDANEDTLQGTANGDLPSYDDPANVTPEQLCFVFRKNNATAYLGISDRANKKGIVDQDMADACADAITGEGGAGDSPTALLTSPNTPTMAYFNLGGGSAANDASWAKGD